MYTDTEFVRGLAKYGRMVEKHVGPLSVDTMPIYYSEMNRYMTYLQKYGVANEGHLKRFVLGMVKRAMNAGVLISHEVVAQLYAHYGVRLLQLKQETFDIEDLSHEELDYVLSPMLMDTNGTIVSIMLLGKTAQEVAA